MKIRPFLTWSLIPLMSINISKKTLIKILILLSITVVIYRLIEKTITYQEEVKLSNGEMIWVDIKRHYWLSGGALGDVGSFTGNYMPSTVEISWDTGFEGVGRRSVFFDGEHAFQFIDKVNGIWYVKGDRTRCNANGIEGGVYGKDGVCQEGLGNRLKHSAYLYVLSSDGFLKDRNLDELPPSIVYNILDVRQLREISYPPTEFDGKKISWQQKLNYQNTRKGYGSIFGKSVRPLN